MEAFINLTAIGLNLYFAVANFRSMRKYNKAVRDGKMIVTITPPVKQGIDKLKGTQVRLRPDDIWINFYDNGMASFSFWCKVEKLTVTEKRECNEPDRVTTYPLMAPAEIKDV